MLLTQPIMREINIKLTHLSVDLSSTCLAAEQSNTMGGVCAGGVWQIEFHFHERAEVWVNY